MRSSLWARTRTSRIIAFFTPIRDSPWRSGALVTEDRRFEGGKLILGSPAKAVRDLTPEQAAGLRRSAEIYVANARRYAAGLKAV